MKFYSQWAKIDSECFLQLVRDSFYTYEQSKRTYLLFQSCKIVLKTRNWAELVFFENVK